MSHDPPDGAHAPETFDRIAEDLQALRAAAGHVSYAEIAARIAARRESAGVAWSAATIARSTVYDAFRTGRTRVNPALIGEIVVALGSDADTADEWMLRCQRARECAERPVAPAASTRRLPTHAALPPIDAAPSESAGHPPRRMVFVVVVMLASCVINIAGNLIVEWLRLPLYLDMIGTAVTAMALGPWAGVAVAVTSNVGTAAIGGPLYIPFALVNVVGALIWGYGVRRFGFGRTFPRFILLNLIVAVACSLTAVLVILALFNGETEHATEDVVTRIEDLNGARMFAIVAGNILAAVPDKLLAGFVALCVVEPIARRWPSQVRGLDLTILRRPQPAE